MAGASLGAHGDAVKRDTALARLNRLCASFIDAELDLDRFSSAAYRQQMSDGKDPLLKLKADALKAFGGGDATRISNAIRAALATQDMQLIQKTGLGLTSEGYFFDGRTYSGSSGTQAYTAALSLAVCEMGERCGDGDYVVLKNCAAVGECASSRKELVVRTLRNELHFSDSEVARVIALSQDMANALRGQDAGKFAPAAR